MKVCKWSSKTSETKSTQKSSGSDLEDGFINTGITMENKDEAGYTSLQREPVGYQALKPPIYLEVLDSPGTVSPPECSIAPEDDCGYTLPKSSQAKIFWIHSHRRRLNLETLLPRQSPAFTKRSQMLTFGRRQNLDTCIH